MWTELRTDLPKTKKLTVFAMLLATGTVLNYLEAMIPVFNILPGAKLGIANVVTMLAMVWFGPFYALSLGILRSALVGLMSGAVTMLIYGGAGTVLSVGAMWMFLKLFKDKITMAGISMLGAFFFNVGQIAVAAAVIHNMQMFRYLPVLTLVSTVSGLLTGIVAKRISEKQMMGE
ncbi:MAG: Gx transporter family protein [Clostridia bacterium]|nr:Gx transporter family protein [Clostridia bacterium]